MVNGGANLEQPCPLIAVDVGNARIKLGLFRRPAGPALPVPENALQLTARADFERLAAWLAEIDGLSPPAGPAPPDNPLAWYIGSVNRPAAARLIDWLRDHRPADRVSMLAADDLPLVVRLARPDMVGVDRLLDAVAANRLRTPQRPAVVVDVGSAITVDLVSADGAFLGGAILPGIAMSARALNEFTDLLPRIDMSELALPPPAVGTATEAAIRAGLFWGAVGAVRQLVHQMAGPGQADVFMTGGASPAVAALVYPAATLVPHLTLAGIALTADR
jgi:type III pantothenate kinase